MAATGAGVGAAMEIAWPLEPLEGRIETPLPPLSPAPLAGAAEAPLVGSGATMGAGAAG